MMHPLPSSLLLSLISVLLLPSSASANPRRPARRSLTTSFSDLDGQTFDYVIVGGGTAGLVVAARLAENANLKIAVLEAGGTGEEYAESINVPGMAYLNGTGHTAADWAYMTVNQTYAPGPSQQKYWPRGKLLGGSSATNGLFYNSASSTEYDGWDLLNPGGAQSWGWATMEVAMKKAETYTAPTSAQVETFGIPEDAGSHGTSGPLHASYSGYIYQDNSRWVPALVELGLPKVDVSSAGLGRGVGFSTSAINPANETRSYSKSAYIDPVARSNLVILTGARVTKLLWGSTSDGNATATGVQFASEAAGTVGTTYTVKASKDVIFAGGSINTPQLLQLSGVGPSALLSGLGIDVVVDLPGVGYNLQDHVSSPVYFRTTSTTGTWNDLTNTTHWAEELAKFSTDPSESQWSYVNSGIAFLSASDLFGDKLAAFVKKLDVDDMVALNKDHNVGVDDTVLAGWKAQHNQSISFLSSTVGDVQLLFTLKGGGTAMVGVQISYMHPFARGSVLITSSDPFAAPAVNPNYFDNSIDLEVCRAALEFIRKIPNTTAWDGWVVEETAPGSTVTSNDDVDTYLGKTSGTSYHPIGTAAMLPRSLGGVVDTNLRVYGTSNVRVIDASIIPLQVAANTQRTAYGIAERGAELVQLSSNNSPSSSSSSSSGRGTGTGKSGAESLRPARAAILVFAIGVACSAL